MAYFSKSYSKIDKACYEHASKAINELLKTEIENRKDETDIIVAANLYTTKDWKKAKEPKIAKPKPEPTEEE